MEPNAICVTTEKETSSAIFPIFNKIPQSFRHRATYGKIPQSSSALCWVYKTTTRSAI